MATRKGAGFGPPFFLQKLGRKHKMHTTGWIAHVVPFAALFSAEIPPNRPALTRLSEQATVAIIAALGTVQYNAHQEEKQLAVLTVQVQQWQQATQHVIDAHQAQIDRLRADLYQPRQGSK